MIAFAIMLLIAGACYGVLHISGEGEKAREFEESLHLQISNRARIGRCGAAPRGGAGALAI